MLKPVVQQLFDIGETVKVIDGPFQSFNGTVESVDEEAARLEGANKYLWARDAC